MGLTGTFIEAPLALQKIIGNIPKAQLEICDEQCFGTSGNAAGNRADHFDLTGAADPHHVPKSGYVSFP